ncbi:MAG TPA: hypothetical protein VKP30_27710 [Polyangiaceae bacterium]|nr:hypothetical protein [Polyangiaceae bacterium]
MILTSDSSRVITSVTIRYTAPWCARRAPILVTKQLRDAPTYFVIDRRHRGASTSFTASTARCTDVIHNASDNIEARRYTSSVADDVETRADILRQWPTTSRCTDVIHNASDNIEARADMFVTEHGVDAG